MFIWFFTLSVFLDLILMVLDASKAEIQRELLTYVKFISLTTLEPTVTAHQSHTL